MECTFENQHISISGECNIVYICLSGNLSRDLEVNDDVIE